MALRAEIQATLIRESLVLRAVRCVAVQATSIFEGGVHDRVLEFGTLIFVAAHAEIVGRTFDQHLLGVAVRVVAQGTVFLRGGMGHGLVDLSRLVIVAVQTEAFHGLVQQHRLRRAMRRMTLQALTLRDRGMGRILGGVMAAQAHVAGRGLEEAEGFGVVRLIVAGRTLALGDGIVE